MLDLDRPIKTRDGKAARIICRDSRVRSGPLAVLIDAGDRELLRSYRADGRAYRTTAMLRDGRVSQDDLINVPTLVKRWRVTFVQDPALPRAPAYYETTSAALMAHTAYSGNYALGNGYWTLAPDVQAIKLVEIDEAELPHD